MKNVLLIGDSGGIGGALNDALRARHVKVVGLSRSKDGFDFRNPESIQQKLDGVSSGFDAILVATGALTTQARRPEKSLSEVTAEQLASQFATNAIGPAIVLRNAPRLLSRSGRSVFAAISAKVGSIGDNRMGGWYSYRASKAALNQFVHTAAIELKRTHPDSICVTLHPGTVATRFTKDYKAHPKIAPETSAANLLNVLDGLNSSDTGRFYNWDGSILPW